MHHRLCALATSLALLGLSLTTTAQPAAAARYALGSVPDQTVWSGSERSFHLHWNDRPGVTMTVAASPAPAGPLILEPSAATDWRFHYRPAAADKTPFTVTVAASLGGETTAQSWQITPQPVLPPEAAVFGADQHTQPIPFATAGIRVFDRPTPLAESLNYQQQILRDVRIIGETVELEANHPNGLYEAYGNGDRRDLKRVEIIAERLIIRSPVRFKQTQVTLQARELIFEGAGQIKTTPEERTQSAGINAAGGLNGADGLPAGHLTLQIGALHTDGPGVRFDLTGGAGQPGGPGEHGAAGASIDTYWSSARVCDSGMCKTHTPPDGTYIVYYRYTLAGTTVSQRGVNRWPGDGSNAKPSGKPGEGGRGGSLVSNLDLAGRFSLAGGRSAAPTLPTAWPYDRYAGGAAGTPVRSQKVRFYVEWFQMKSSAESRTSKAGTDAAIQRARTAAGPNGTYTLTEAPLGWLHPLALRQVLQHLRDDYLGNRLDTVAPRLADYAEILAAYRAGPVWTALDPTARFEFEQMHAEIRLLQQRLEAGLDYFGNPAGWVPMLSFEVNFTLFQNEIDRAMDTLYLAYWINNKAQTEQQRLESLTAARNQLRTELDQARRDYNAAMTRLPRLRTQAAQLHTDIQNVQIKLEAKELELLEDTREPDWVFGLRFGLKLSAMMCQMIPVYQPALGTVGEGLRVASDFNPDRPWDSIQGAGDVASTYLASDFESSAQGQQNAQAGVDPAQAESMGLDYLGALQTTGNGLTKGVADIQAFLKQHEAPSPEMLAELERLKARSPEYKALLEEVEALMERNRQFTEELILTMQQVATLSGVLSRNLLAIDALNRRIAPGALVLDERATSYLEDMERRAYDRLLKYHYYLAKAYEYRLLEPYTEPLNLEGLVERFEAIATLNQAPQLTPDQFHSLRAVFQDKLSRVAETIFDRYNANRPELSAPLRFSLSAEQIATLNAGGTVRLNLRDAGYFPPHEENLRIVDLRVTALTTAPGPGQPGSTAYVDLYLAHAGISLLKRDGAIHRFQHYNHLTDNPIVWGARFDLVGSQIDPIRPSDASGSLLRSLLSGAAVTDMLLYSRPSAWADLLLSRSSFNSLGDPIQIETVRLELVYDFTPRRPALDLRELEILTATTEPDGLGGTTRREAALLPYIALSRPDRNGRQDARGRFLRVFPSSLEPLQIVAPARYGQYQFEKWTDRFGRDLPVGPLTDPVLDLTLAGDLTLVAQYGPATADSLELSPPLLSNGRLRLRWNGGPGIRLQTTPSLGHGPWQDVAGSAGQSEIEVPAVESAAFFRLVR
ncbi:MAG: hypothetical protein HS113_12520 [Verrucomicrobiales bacterium]|nr:hypothetical protein [Verrucomicrobiales bacterium]